MLLGLVGTGYWGSLILRTLSLNKQVKHILVCDLNKDRLQELKKEYGEKISVFENYDQMLSISALEGVIVATPPDSHYLLGIKVLKAKKNLFVEKPMCTTSLHAMILNELSFKQKKILQVGHTFLYLPAITYLKKLIDHGELGEIVNINFEFGNLGKIQKAGVAQDLLPHSISLIKYLTGKEIVFSKYFCIDSLQKGIDDVGYLILKWNKGIANVFVSWLNPNKTRKMTITGTKKMATFDDIESLEKVRIYDKGVTLQESTSSWGQTICSYRHGDITIPNIPAGEPLVIEIQDFIDCIKTGRKPLSDGNMGYEVVRLLEEGIRNGN